MKVIADAQIPYLQNYFQDEGELVLVNGRHISKDDVKDADILLVRSVTPVNEALLEGSSVKFVGSVTAGVDHLDTHWLDQAGIYWQVATGFNAPPVADYVVSTIAALQLKGFLQAKQLKAAVVGVGHVGRLVVERLKQLNFSVSTCDPYRAEMEPEFESTPLLALEELDLISLHVPLTKTTTYPTYHFIDKDFFQKQKENCILINASRGAVINTNDLLQYGSHLQYCFDVWQHEPRIDKSLLEKILIATPHIAGYSVQSKMRGVDMVYQAICKTGLIQPRALPPLSFPRQTLNFAGSSHHWQDIVLGIFNPMLLSAMMRALILPAKDEGRVFDHMRHEFDYRNEFAFTSVSNAQLNEAGQHIIRSLGIELI